MTTIQDMVSAVRLELDKSNISSFPNFTEDEICYFINRAYLMVINKKSTGHNVLETPFEGNVKRVMDLRNLVKQVDIQGSVVSGRVDNEYRFGISNKTDILFPIQYIISFDKKDSSNDIRTAILIRHSDSNKFKKTSNNNPWIPEPVILFDSENINIYVDPVDLLDYSGSAKLNLTYMQRPVYLAYWLRDPLGNVTLNTTGDATQIPEVDKHVLPEIVAETVDLMLDNIESQRIQTHPTITQQSE